MYFSSRLTIPYSWKACLTSGQPIYAQVVSGGENANPKNDLVSSDLGSLAAPDTPGAQLEELNLPVLRIII
jgi:hypothetical protein